MATFNRVPSVFFETRGSGDSDHPVHAGAFHQALYSAGIHSYNIIQYSSVLPACAVLVDRDKTELPCFGSELYTIMAIQQGEEGERITAGIAYGWLYDPETDEKLGGIVCEIGIKGTEEELRPQLRDTLEEMHAKTFAQYTLKDVRLLTETHVAEKKHGVALCALCFTEFKTQEDVAEASFPALIRTAKELRKKQNLAGYGGTTIPGEYILKRCPDFFERLKNTVRTIMVGGTNGKTTTTAMIVHMLRAKGFRVFSNREGANKTEGIATAYALHCNTHGGLDYDFAVIECDELFLQPMIAALDPDVLVLTNIYQDQIERLISAEHTAQEIVRAVSTLSSCTLCLNHRMNYYDDIRESFHGKRLVTYAAEAEQAIEIDGSPYVLEADIPFRFNVENAAAAASALAAEGLLDQACLESLKDYRLPFGRCDKIRLPSSEIILALAKNQLALEANTAELAPLLPGSILILSYEHPADYLWLTDLSPDTYRTFSMSTQIYTYGQYADDMLRILQEKCTCINRPEVLSDDRLRRICRTTTEPILAETGYYGMLKIHKLLAEEHYTKPFWEE